MFRRNSLRDDSMAGVVLGVESVPDGLASGLLAGVNPVAGLYGYLFGMVGGALFTSTAFMTVQATGAMSIIVGDVGLGGRDDPARSLFTLSMVTGLVMILAGVLRLGRFLRFVSNSVMTGFITAVGVNIVLGQMGDFTGYDAPGRGRIARTVNTLLDPGSLDVPTLTVGLVTVAGIVWLTRTRMGPLGLVVAVIFGSALAAAFNRFGHDITTIGDVADVPRSLPLPTLPILSEIPGLLVPAASLAFVGLVQGAGVSAGFPNADGSPSNPSQDFVGQGAGNIVSGVFQGMPVGGSMSASAIAAQAGARSRAALIYAAVVMAFVIVVLADAVERVAMPSLAGLLIMVGIGTVKPRKVIGVASTGSVPLTVMSITFLLTLIIPLQFSVVVGVALSVLLFVIGQSSNLTLRRLEFHDDGRMREVDPPEELGPREVVVIQPYGPLFFATASILLEQLPTVTPSSRQSVVILRARGADEAGATLIEVLGAYAALLREVDSKLVIVTDNGRLVAQLRDVSVVDVIDSADIYRGNEYLGETVRRAYTEALGWIERQPRVEGDPSDDPTGVDT
jgi:sulfate permease, SulP family